MGSYLGQVLAPALSFLIAWIIDDSLTDGNYIGEFMSILSGTKFLFYTPIFLGQLVFAILGSDFILFSWIDNVLIFFIMHYVSNLTFLFLALDLSLIGSL